MNIRTPCRALIEKALRRLNFHPDLTGWAGLLSKDSRWEEARSKSQNGPKVLIATSFGGHTPSTTVESLLAVALTLRGVNVSILLCDEFLPACMPCSLIRFPDPREFVREGPQKKVCWDCYSVGLHAYKPLRLPILRYSKLVAPDEIEQAHRISESISADCIENYNLDGVAVGEHARAGALRFFARGTLDEEATGEQVLRRYFRASLLATFAMQRLFSTCEFACACFNHGIYVPQGLIGEVARQRGVRVVNWNPAYRKKCFVFSHEDTYHHTLLSEPVDQWENLQWSHRLESQLMHYLMSRWQGTQDWIKFNRNPQEDVAAISGETGIQFNKPTIGMLTNVMWDAQLHYRANAFPNMLEWALATIRYFAKRPELQLVIRVHPAELTGFLPSRQPIIDEIRRHIPDLPQNVFLIPPESKTSTYVVMQQCNAVIIYGTKTGVELTSLGIPVIVAGEAWIRNKGLTLDASSPEEYFRLLDQLPLSARMDEATTQQARKYAYHFFFRRMIPINCMEPARRFAPYRIRLSNLDDLLPGKDPGLDVICDGILKGSPFVFPAEAHVGEV